MFVEILTLYPACEKCAATAKHKEEFDVNVPF